MHLLFATIAALLCCIAISASGYAASSDKPTTPQKHFDLGSLLSVDLYYNTTRSKNKLTLSKSYVKYVLNAGSQEKLPLLFWKYSRLDELINCDNLTLLDQDYESLLDCRPLQTHLSEGTVASTGASSRSGPGNYLERTSIRHETRINPIFKQRVADNLFYPMRDDVVQEKIESDPITNNFGKLNQKELNPGYYAEIRFGGKDPIFVCHLEYLLSFNDSKTYFVDSSDLWAEMLSDLAYMKEQFADGLMISLQNIVCHKSGVELFALRGNFTIITRQQFPYLTVRHSIVSDPIEQIWKYEASIDQKRNLECADAYNTSISIKSRSMFATALNFDLNQEFAHLEANSGREEMMLIHPSLSVLVESLWNEENFVKKVNLYVYENKEWLGGMVKNLTDAMRFKYTDMINNEHISMTLEILRSIVPSLTNMLDMIDLDAEPLDDIQSSRDEL